MDLNLNQMAGGRECSLGCNERHIQTGSVQGTDTVDLVGLSATKYVFLRNSLFMKV